MKMLHVKVVKNFSIFNEVHWNFRNKSLTFQHTSQKFHKTPHELHKSIQGSHSYVYVAKLNLMLQW